MVLDAINYIGLVSYKDISLADKIHRDNFTSSLIWEDKDLLSISRSLINKNKSKNIHKVERFDLILARHVLEHLSNPIVLIESLRSMIKKNGIIYFEIPSPVFMIERGLLFFIEEHTSYFSIKSLKKFSKNIILIHILIF